MKYEKEILHFLNGGEVEFRGIAYGEGFEKFKGVASLRDLKRYLEKDEMELRIKPEPVYEYQWVIESAFESDGLGFFRGGKYFTEHEVKRVDVKKLIDTKRERKS